MARINWRRNSIIYQPAEFQWDPSVIGVVSSIQAYGGLFCIFGGFFFNKLGGSVGCSFAIIVYSILTLLQPAGLYLDFRLFLVLRLFIGFFSVIEINLRTDHVMDS